MFFDICNESAEDYLETILMLKERLARCAPSIL